MFKRFFPRSSDNNLTKGVNSTLARFGHLNALIDYINRVPPGSGITSVQPGTNINIDDSDPLNPIINVDSITGDYLPLAGGTMDSGATINFDNAARLQQGTNADGANGGIALRCSIDYELKWEAGKLYVMEQDGFIIREVRYTRFLTPTANDDVLIGYVQNSRWVLDNGDTYVCIDPTEGNAVWERLLNANECVPLTGTAYGDITGIVGVSVRDGGQIILDYPNGDVITLGTEFDNGTVYSAIGFTQASSGSTTYLYMRGNDLYFRNPDTGETVDGLMRVIAGLESGKLNCIPLNTGTQTAIGTSNYLYLGFNGKQYLDNGLSSYKGYTLMPRHYFVDSCTYSQSGTAAPTQDSVFETQVGDNVLTSKNLTRQGVGHYRIEYIQQFGANYLPSDFSKIKVVTSQGAEPSVNISYTFPGFTSTTSLAIDVFTRNPSTGNLTDSLLDKSLIEVYFYL
jgi:hypothetical protein